MKSSLVELRRQAEQAVHDMPNGDLKIKAFETILTHLLSSVADSGVETVARNKKPVPTDKQKNTKTPTSFAERVLSLKADGFFEAQRSIAEIRQELKKNGWHYPVTSMSGPSRPWSRRRRCAGNELTMRRLGSAGNTQTRDEVQHRWRKKR